MKFFGQCDARIGGRFAGNDGFINGAKNFNQQVHTELGKQDAEQTKPKGGRELRLAQKMRDSSAEKIRERGEKQMERTGKAKEGNKTLHGYYL